MCITLEKHVTSQCIAYHVLLCVSSIESDRLFFLILLNNRRWSLYHDCESYFRFNRLVSVCLLQQFTVRSYILSNISLKTISFEYSVFYVVWFYIGCWALPPINIRNFWSFNCQYVNSSDTNDIPKLSYDCSRLLWRAIMYPYSKEFRFRIKANGMCPSSDWKSILGKISESPMRLITNNWWGNQVVFQFDDT